MVIRSNLVIPQLLIYNSDFVIEGWRTNDLAHSDMVHSRPRPWRIHPVVLLRIMVTLAELTHFLLPQLRSMDSPNYSDS